MKNFYNQLSLFGSKTNGQEKKYLSVFTQLFAQMNISIRDNTLSIYPKVKGRTICDLMDNDSLLPVAEKIGKLLNSLREDRKGRFMSNDTNLTTWRKHQPLHDDTFCQLDLHYHYEFEETIHNGKLTELLDLFQQLDLITSVERDACVCTFKSAHTLQVADYLASLSRVYLDDLRESIKQRCIGDGKNALRTEADKVVSQLEQLFMLHGSSMQVHQYTKDIQLMMNCPTRENIARLRELSMYKKEIQAKLLIMALLLMPVYTYLVEHETKSIGVVESLAIIGYLALLGYLALPELPYFCRHHKWVNPPESLGALCQEMQQVLSMAETASFMQGTEEYHRMGVLTV